jgi:hypothetical protein
MSEHTCATTNDSSVWRWRFHRLAASGYPELLAALLAESDEVDVDLACRLVTEGECPPELAARIVL